MLEPERIVRTNKYALLDIDLWQQHFGRSITDLV